MHRGVPGRAGGDRRLAAGDRRALAGVRPRAAAAGVLGATDLALVARRALAARTVIEQAKGLIAIQAGMDVAASFDHLRALAQAENILLETLARDVVSRAARPRG